MQIITLDLYFISTMHYYTVEANQSTAKLRITNYR